MFGKHSESPPVRSVICTALLACEEAFSSRSGEEIS